MMGPSTPLPGRSAWALRTPASLYGEDLKTVGEFTVEAGQSIPFVLSYGSSFQSPRLIDPFRALEQTEAFWRQWSDRCPGVWPWTEEVKRSLITLKALTYAPTGGMSPRPITSSVMSNCAAWVNCSDSILHRKVMRSFSSLLSLTQSQ